MGGRPPRSMKRWPGAPGPVFSTAGPIPRPSEPPQYPVRMPANPATKCRSETSRTGTRDVRDGGCRTLPIDGNGRKHPSQTTRRSARPSDLDGPRDYVAHTETPPSTQGNIKSGRETECLAAIILCAHLTGGQGRARWSARPPCRDGSPTRLEPHRNETSAMARDWFDSGVGQQAIGVDELVSRGWADWKATSVPRAGRLWPSP